MIEGHAICECGLTLEFTDAIPTEPIVCFICGATMRWEPRPT